MRLASFIAATLLMLATPAGSSPLEAQARDDEARAIQAESHVGIHFQYDYDQFFPDPWKAPSLQMEAMEITPGDMDRMIPVIRHFLSAHPAHLVGNDLEHIYLLGKLSFMGKRYGGAHFNKSIYVVWDPTRKCDEAFMLERLHSEFSSLLLDHHPFQSASWEQLNPPGFKYTGTGFEMLDSPNLYTFSDQICAEGFLLPYGTSSMENDFNMISAWLFTKKDELDAVSLKYEKIGQKQALAEQFYTSLSAQYHFD